MGTFENIRLAVTDAADLAAVRMREGMARLFSRRGERTEEPAFLRFQAMAGPLLVYTVRYGDTGDAVRVMEVDGAYQSATYVEEGREYDPPFDYLQAYDCVYQARDDAGNAAPVARLLMLGGGGFAYPKHVVAHHPESAIHVVELDPMVVAVARRYFFLDRCEVEFDTARTGRLTVTEGDAVAFLREFATPEFDGMLAGNGSADEDAAAPADATFAPFDCILNDLFSGKNPVADLASVKGAQLVKACLAPGGLYVSNVISALEGPGAQVLTDLAATYKQVFAHVYVLPVGASAQDDRDNNMLIASDTPWHITGAREL